jgi:hypothetical protein
MPVSPCVMRPRFSTAVASTNTTPAPPCANLPRWTRCQSPACPSVAEYWHIGETTTRFLRVTPLMVSASNSTQVVSREVFLPADFFSVIAEAEPLPFQAFGSIFSPRKLSSMVTSSGSLRKIWKSGGSASGKLR